MKLRISRHADHRLRKIKDYIARDNPYAADRVEEAIRSAARLLTDHPEMGRAVEGTRSREWPVRSLPYVIIYRIDPSRNELVILTVLHGAEKR